MSKNNESNFKICISCNGTGKIKCDCQGDNQCFICSGNGGFKCPVCEGTGRF